MWAVRWWRIDIFDWGLRRSVLILVSNPILAVRSVDDCNGNGHNHDFAHIPIGSHVFTWSWISFFQAFDGDATTSGDRPSTSINPRVYYVYHQSKMRYQLKGSRPVLQLFIDQPCSNFTTSYHTHTFDSINISPTTCHLTLNCYLTGLANEIWFKILSFLQTIPFMNKHQDSILRLGKRKYVDADESQTTQWSHFEMVTFQKCK